MHLHSWQRLDRQTLLVNTVKANPHFVCISAVFTWHVLPQMECLENFSSPVCNTLKSTSVASIKIPSAKELINHHYATSKLTTATSKVIYFCPLHFFNPAGEQGLLSLNCQNNQLSQALGFLHVSTLLGGEKKISHHIPPKTLPCHANTWRTQWCEHLKFSYLE